MSAMLTIHMKYQALFSPKNNKEKIKMSFIIIVISTEKLLAQTALETTTLCLQIESPNH